MTKKIKLNKGHWIEAVDRTYMTGDIVDRMLMDHPVYQQNPKLKKKLNKVSSLIFELYQEIEEMNYKNRPETLK